MLKYCWSSIWAAGFICVSSAALWDAGHTHALHGHQRRVQHQMKEVGFAHLLWLKCILISIFQCIYTILFLFRLCVICMSLLKYIVCHILGELMCGTFRQFCCAVIQTFCCPQNIQSQIMEPNSSVSLAWRVMIFLAIFSTHTSFAVIIVSQTSLIRERYCSAVHGLVWPRTHFQLLLRRTAAVPIRERHFYC